MSILLASSSSLLSVEVEGGGRYSYMSREGVEGGTEQVGVDNFELVKDKLACTQARGF